MASGEIIDEGSGMNDGLVQAAIGGATLGAGNLATCGLPDPAICLPQSKTDRRYRPCDINERFNVAVFTRGFADVSHGQTSQ